MSKKKKKQSASVEISLEQIVYDFILKNPAKNYFRKKHLSSLMTEFSSVEIHEALEKLVKAKLLLRDSNHSYSLPHSLRQDDKVLKGRVDMTTAGYAFIEVEGRDNDVFVNQRNLNGALQGDVVKVEIFSRKGKRAEGEITEVIKRAQETFIGTINIQDGQAFLIPDQRNINFDILISKSKLHGTKEGEKAAVRILDWGNARQLPEGEVVEDLGKSGLNDVEMKSILIENGFPLVFPDSVIKESEAIPFDIPEKEIENRRDFRAVTTFTIDPEDAKDFDDAVSIEKFDDQYWEIGVHIADVSHYVQEDSELDKEAQLRATSVYLVDRVNPMFPEKISNHVCSLRPNEDKLCFAAVFVINEKAEIKSVWLGKTIIHSDKRFSYEEAQDRLETHPQPPLAETQTPAQRGLNKKFTDELLTLNKIAYALREKRFDNGAIAFETQEVKFKLDENAKPIALFVKERKDAHLLIEDFMLLANKTVAEFISSKTMNKRAIPFPYRVHDQPDKAKLEAFAMFARKFGYQVSMKEHSKIASTMNTLMEKIRGKKEQNVLEQLAIRSMAKAIYTTKNIGHYGLGFEKYCHFTSPIRRYPDVMAHRILFALLENEPVPDMGSVEAQCKQSSLMERNAMTAERASTKYKQVEFMMERVGQEFDAIIAGVTHFGIFVEVIETKCEGLVGIEFLPADEYIYDDSKLTLTGVMKGKEFTLGDAVRVKLIKADLKRRQLDFELV